jgi:hypothetical protein
MAIASVTWTPATPSNPVPDVFTIDPQGDAFLIDTAGDVFQTNAGVWAPVALPAATWVAV